MTHQVPDCSICALLGQQTPAIAIVGVSEPCPRCQALFPDTTAYAEHASCGPHLELALVGSQQCPHGVKLVFGEPRPVGTTP